MIRWKGIIAFITIIGTIFVISVFFADSWIESAVEDLASEANGAKVEIDGLHFSIFEVYLKWNRLQVTNPNNTMENTLETGPASFDMEFLPLLKGKIIVEEMKLENIRTGTPRSDDGKLEKTITEKSERKKDEEPGFFSESLDKLKKEAENRVLPDFSSIGDKFNPDKIVKGTKLQSIEKMDSLKVLLEHRYSYWDSVFANTTVEKDAKEIEADIKSINVKNLNDPVTIKNSLVKIEKIRENMAKLKKEYDELNAGAKNDYEMLNSSRKDISRWIKDDYKALYKVANLPDFSFEGIGRYLFGNAYINNITDIIGYVGMARSALNSEGEETVKEEDPPRLKGQNIRFRKHQVKPDFWIKAGKLSGTAKNIALAGSVTDIVTNQKLIGRPTVLKLSGKNDKGAGVKVNAEFNYLRDIPKEEILASVSGISLKNYKLGNSPYFPEKIADGTGKLNLKFLFNGNNFSGNIVFTADKITFPPKAAPKEKIKKLIYETLSKVNNLKVEIKVKGANGKITYGVNSSLDKTLKKAFSESIKGEIEAMKKQVRQKADKEIKKREKELNKMIAKYRAQMDKKLGKYSSLLNAQEKNISAKKSELEKKLGKSGKDIEKKLKNLIKF
jgi:uncharacterized protein (TIGR03545 family)